MGAGDIAARGPTTARGAAATMAGRPAVEHRIQEHGTPMSPVNRPTREERRDAARRTRTGREAAAAASATRRRRLTRLGAVLAAAAVVVAVLVAVSASGSS